MKSAILLSLFVFLTLACTTEPPVRTDKSAEARFTHYKTFAYLPTGEKDDQQTGYTPLIIREVQEEMEARGYELDNASPDLLVKVKTMFEKETNIQRVTLGPSYDYYTPGFFAPSTLSPYYYTGYATIPRVTGHGIREIEYTEGTFVVDVIDASKQQIIWRGWTRTPIDRLEPDKAIRAYIENIFEEYPVPAE